MLELNTILYEISHLIAASKTPMKIAITGGVHVGKTTAMRALYAHLHALGIKCSGIAENAVFTGEVRIGYDFEVLGGDSEDVALVHRWPVARRAEGAAHYTFDADAWALAAQWMKSFEGQDVMLVDELGRLEARGEGLMVSLAETLRRHPRHIILAVRGDVLDEIERRIGRFDKIFRIGASGVDVRNA